MPLASQAADLSTSPRRLVSPKTNLGRRPYARWDAPQSLFALLSFVMIVSEPAKSVGVGAEPRTTVAALRMKVRQRQSPFDRHSARVRGPEEAVHCLIHVRDFHESAAMSPRTREVVDAVQNDIVSIVLALRESAELDVAGVYTEGVRVRDLKALRKFAPEPALAFREEFRQYVERELATPGRKELALTHGRIGMLTGLPVLAAELPWTYDAALTAISQQEANPAKRRRSVEADRENALLEIIAADDRPFAIAVFGGAHDWCDNIAAWNKAHPREKFALVEITPFAYHWSVVDGKSPKLLRPTVRQVAAIDTNSKH